MMINPSFSKRLPHLVTCLTLTIINIGSVCVYAAPNDYYDMLRARPQYLKSWSLRDQTQLNNLVDSSPSTCFTYNPLGDNYLLKQDGAKLIKPPRADFASYPSLATYGTVGDESIPGKQRLIFPLGISSGSMLLTWDFFWGKEFKTNTGTVDAWKTFRMFAGSGTGGTQNYWSLHDVMGYSGRAIDELSRHHENLHNTNLYAPGNLDLDPYQPTGLGAVPKSTFLTNVGVWTRYWIEIRLNVPGSEFTEWSQTYMGGTPLTGTWDMCSLWIADEGRTPVRVIYRVPVNRADLMLSQFRIQFDTSSNNINPGTGLTGPVIGYARNVTILRDLLNSHLANESDTALFARPVGSGGVPPPIDTTPPSVAVTAPAGGSTVSGTVAISATASDNVVVAGVQFKNDGVNVGAEDTVAPYSVSWNTSVVLSGTHSLTAVARDSSGNTTTSTVVKVTVAASTADTSAPSVSLTAPAAGATVSGTVTVSANASDNIGVVGVQFKRDGVNIGAEDTTSPYSISWNTTTVANGSHTITAVARDAAGNSTTSSARSVTVSNSTSDTTNPTVSLTAPAAGATVSGTVTVSANASDNIGVVGVQFKRDGVNIGAEDTTSPYAISWNTTTTANGSHAITAVARDAAGNSTTSSARSVTVSNSTSDTTNPTVSLTAPAAGATVSTTVTVSANASDNVGVVGVQFKRDGVNIGAEDTTSPYSISWNTTTVANGSHTITAVARDAAGNSTTSSARSVTVSNIDTTIPTVSITSPASGATVSNSVTVSAAASDNVGVVGVQFKRDGLNIGGEDTISPYSISWDTTSVANGSHTITAVARDAAGTSASITIGVTVNNADVTPPHVSVTSPADGATVSGSIPFSANASDNVGVMSVQFRVDGIFVGTDSTAPYSISLDTKAFSNGSHSLIARAFDTSGNPATSTAIDVTINNPVLNALSGGEGHSVVLKDDGTVWTWGLNGNGQLGIGSTTKSTTPVQIPSMSAVEVFAGSSFTVMLKEDGTVWTCGQNSDGQLGDGSTVQRTSPVMVSGLTDVVTLSAGWQHVIAVKTDGTVWSWGEGSYGQMGNNTTEGINMVPVQVPGLTGVSAVAAGDHYSVALKSDGTVWAWGQNNNGQLGNGTTTTARTPVQVPGLSGVVQIAAGSSHTLAMKSDGTVWAWGNGNAGRLGNGSVESSSVPVKTLLSGACSQIAAGGLHSIALKEDGSAWSWGNNSDGQLGDGTFNHKLVPAQVDVGTATSIGAGRYHSIALKSDGTVWTFGRNSNSQLGDGTMIDSSTPLQVNGLNLITP
jgi:alpha-tubulin suppressor-like RCC1 family protein